MILLFQIATASTESEAVEALAEEFGLDESGPIRLRPSVILSRLESVSKSCDFESTFTGSYSAGEWSGILQGREATGSYSAGEWSGVAVSGSPISDANYGSGEIHGNHAGSPVVGVHVRTKGNNGYFVAVAGCGVVQALVLGQSNCVGKPGGPEGSVLPGELWINSLKYENYGQKVGVTQAWMEQGNIVQRRCHSGTSVDQWLNQILDNALSSVVISPTVVPWVHGEADSQDLQSAMAYPSKVNSVFDRIEDELGPQSFVWPTLVVSGALPFADVSTSGMIQLASERDDLTIVYTGDLPRPDGRHYTHQDGGYYTLGARLLAPSIPQ